MTPHLAALFDNLRTGHQWLQSQTGHSRKAIVWPDDSNLSSIVIPPIDIKKSLISAAKKIGTHHIHPHQFRHTYATRLMDQGVPMEHIMALVGGRVRRWRNAMRELIRFTCRNMRIAWRNYRAHARRLGTRA